MSARAIRWLLFAALFLALPVPMVGPFDALVPPLRYAILLGAAAAVALAEGAAGPVPGLLLLLGLNLAVSALLAALLAWAASWVLGRLGPRVATPLALLAVLALLITATATELYETGFGRAPTANLIGVLH